MVKFFSTVFCCFASPRVSEENDTKKPKQVVSKSRGAPIPVSYFPVGSNVRGFILHAVKGLKQSLRRYWREDRKPSFESHNCTHVDQAVEASETYTGFL
ncbi:hypothetical protein L1887_37990 [Cichorium endivia]|nr:hypothetical protein L1887_37990 [Cichorium endivia]